jgi:acyl carrier protein
LDFQSSLNDARWQVDSMDLAEIVARIHRDFGVLVFEQSIQPVNWADIVRIIADHRARS